MGEKSGMNKVIFFLDLSKLHEALYYFNIQDFAGKRSPIKLHMGEKNNECEKIIANMIKFMNIIQY